MPARTAVCRLWIRALAFLALLGAGALPGTSGAEEPLRVQRALNELASLRSIAADVTNVNEQTLWQSRIALAEKEVDNSRKLAALEEREKTLAAGHALTARDVLMELLRGVESQTEAPLKQIRDLDERIRRLKSLRLDRAESLKALTGDTEEAAQQRADLEQSLRNLDGELQARDQQRGELELKVRLAGDATRIDAYLRTTDLSAQPTIQHILEKRRIGRDATRDAEDYRELGDEMKQRRDGVAQAIAIARERFSHLDEEIGTLQNLYQAVRKPLFSLKQEDARTAERQRQLRAMLADARSQHATLEERLKYGDTQLAALDGSLALLAQGRELQQQYAAFLRFESRQLMDRFYRRISMPAAIIAALIVLHLFISRLLLPLLRPRDTLFVTRRMGTYFLVLMIIVVLAVFFLEDLRAIATVLGIAGAAVVIALQDLCSAFAGWFVIMASGKLRVGDRVEIDGHRGDVIDIQILRTTLLEVNGWLQCDNPTGRIVLVPNSFIFKSQVFNYSHLHPHVWEKVDVVLQFESPAHEAGLLLDRVLREETAEEFEAARAGARKVERVYGMTDAVYEPRIQTKLDPSGTKFTLFFVAHYRKTDEVQSRLVRRILAEFAADPRMRLAYVSQRQVTDNSPVHYSEAGRRA